MTGPLMPRRLLSVSNRGVSAARNFGVAETHSPLIAFLDADDLWLPDKLRFHVEHHALMPADFLCENPTTTTFYWVLRREVFETVGGFVEDMGFSEDLEWLLRVAC